MFIRSKYCFSASKFLGQAFDILAPKTFPKFGLRTVSSSKPLNATLTRLTPQEVNNILRANEESWDFPAGLSAVRSSDHNQLASNSPIEDTKNEAYFKARNAYMFGVFDGHAGRACAQVLAKRLFHYIAACLLSKKELTDLFEKIKAGEPSDLLDVFGDKIDIIDFLRTLYGNSYRAFVSSLINEQEKNVPEALEKAFLSLDDDVSREALLTDDTNGRVSAKTLTVAMSGAVAAVAYIEEAQLHMAYCGDCQAVLGVLNEDQWLPRVLGNPHNSENSEEVHRILMEHPPNERDSIIVLDRLLGQLAPLRAFGDFRYKWDKELLQRVAVPAYGSSVVPPSYLTPPYLTAKPEVISHPLTAKDKFLILATDGLWDLLTPLQAVRLVGEHMRGRTVLTPFSLPRDNMTLAEINQALIVRQNNLSMKPIDSNASTHLIRHALGATECGLDPNRLSQILGIPPKFSRRYRDDISVTVVYFDTEFIRHSMLIREER